MIFVAFRSSSNNNAIQRFLLLKDLFENKVMNEPLEYILMWIHLFFQVSFNDIPLHDLSDPYPILKNSIESFIHVCFEKKIFSKKGKRITKPWRTNSLFGVEKLTFNCVIYRAFSK